MSAVTRALRRIIWGIDTVAHHCRIHRGWLCDLNDWCVTGEWPRD